MGKRGSDAVALLIDGYDISGDTITLSPTREAILELTHGMGDTWEESIYTNLQRGDIVHESFYDDANDKTQEALVGKEGTERTLMAILSNAQGGLAVCFQGAMQRNHARGATRGELHKISANYLSSGRIDETTLIQSLAAESGAGATSDGSLEATGASSEGGPAYLEVTALTLGGYTSITVKLQESSDDGQGDAWVDVVTFANITVAPTSERLVIAASTTVEKWLRVTLTLNGGGSGESITLAVSFLRD